MKNFDKLKQHLINQQLKLENFGDLLRKASEISPI